jgi:enoyl-CoA hydratase/carnithine racemase
MNMADELEVLFSRRGAVGHIKFNRPKALNAIFISLPPIHVGQ